MLPINTAGLQPVKIPSNISYFPRCKYNCWEPKNGVAVYHVYIASIGKSCSKFWPWHCGKFFFNRTDTLSSELGLLNHWTWVWLNRREYICLRENNSHASVLSAIEKCIMKYRNTTFALKKCIIGDANITDNRKNISVLCTIYWNQQVNIFPFHIR